MERQNLAVPCVEYSGVQAEVSGTGGKNGWFFLGLGIVLG